MPADPALPAESADCWAATINKEGESQEQGQFPPKSQRSSGRGRGGTGCGEGVLSASFLPTFLGTRNDAKVAATTTAACIPVAFHCS